MLKQYAVTLDGKECKTIPN